MASRHITEMETPGSFLPSSNDDDEDDEDNDIDSVLDDHSTTMWRAGRNSRAVREENAKNPDSKVQFLYEIRTKLKFAGNAMELRNLELIPQIVDDVIDQQNEHPELGFAFCVHIGTTAPEEILKNRPGFMEGRAMSFLKELQPGGPEGAMRDDIDGAIAGSFFHFGTKRFAGLIMKAYSGPVRPKCEKTDLKPPKQR